MLDMIGQIRAVDDLGRISLPVQYRKLLKIHSGDNLNIQPKGDSLVITKFNVFDSTYAKDVCEAIHQSIYYDIAVVDTEKVVACNSDIHLSGRPISEDIKKCFTNPTLDTECDSEKIIYLSDESTCKVELACPIRCYNKVVGAIVVIETPMQPKLSDLLIKVIESHARLFSYQLHF